MPALLLLLLAILLIGHLAILAASQLRNIGHFGAIQICSNTFGLCDDPLWVGVIAAVLLAVIFWVRRLPRLIARPQQRQGAAMARPVKDSEVKISGQLYTRAHQVQDPRVSWKEDDFDVVEGDRLVGRIYRLDPAGSDWLWGILPEEMPSGRRATGREPSYEDAKVAFRAAWQSRWR
jgi:hypothetical protein